MPKAVESLLLALPSLRSLAAFCQPARAEVPNSGVLVCDSDTGGISHEKLPLKPFDFEAAIQASLEQKALEDAGAGFWANDVPSNSRALVFLLGGCARTRASSPFAKRSDTLSVRRARRVARAAAATR